MTTNGATTVEAVKVDNPNGNAIRDTKKEDLMTDEGMHVDTAMESAKVFSNEDIDATDNVDAAEEDATEEAEEDLNNNELDSASSDADSMAGDYRHLLSVESLAAIAKQQRSDSRVALPKTMVAKELLPADPAVNPFLAREQRLLIDDALWVRDQVLREPHTVHMKSACEGVWYEDLQLAEITAARGNAMLTMGRSYNARTYLLAEEALFLVGRGSLLLFHKGLPMSYRKAFAMLARGPGAIERQRVYDHLKRLGYVITRHGLGFQQFPEDIQQKLGPVKAKREVVVPSNDDVASASLEPRVEAVVAHSLPAESTSDQAISKPLPVAIREDDLLSRQAYAPFAHIYTGLRKVKPLFDKDFGCHESAKETNVFSSPQLAQLQPHFDVYRTDDGKFRRKTAGAPDFKVLVLLFEEPFPSLAQLEHLMRTFPGERIHTALVSAGSLSFGVIQ